MLDSIKVRQELFQFVKKVWPKVSIHFHLSESSNLDWSEIISERVQFPIAVSTLGKQENDHRWGLGNLVYRIPVKTYLVCKNFQQDKVESELCALRNQLHNNQLKLSQVLEISALDFSQDNQANRFFAKHHLPYFAGYLSYDLLIGKGV